MRNQLRLIVLMGGASLAAAAMFLVACSDDTTVNPTDAGGGGEAGKTDGPPVGDGGADADTAPPFDGGFKVDNFDGVLANELCKALARCCYGNPTPADGGADGGTFNVAECEKSYGRVGFEGSNANNELKDGGKLALDQTAAAACITKVKAMTCNLPGSEFKDIRTACFDAYSGTVAAGGACAASIECQKGLFCKSDGDGGAGQCTALRPANGPCGDFDPNRADEACSYRAGGSTGRYCKFFDFAGAGTPLAPADWKCLPAAGMGTQCATSLWCEQSICNNDSVCTTPDRYFAPACGQFLLP